MKKQNWNLWLCISVKNESKSFPVHSICNIIFPRKLQLKYM